VIWQNQDGKEHSYTGVFVQQGIQKETDWFKVAYDDGDEEWMSLQTLETDGTLGLHGNAERRVRWCLMEHAAVDNGLLSQASGRPVIFEPDADAAQLEAELTAAKTEIRDDSGRPSRAAKRKAQEQLAGPAKGQNKQPKGAPATRRPAKRKAAGAAKPTESSKKPKAKARKK